MPMTEIEVRALRAALEALSQNLSDKESTEHNNLWMLPHFVANGELIRANTKVNWNGVVKKSRVDLWATEENDPTHETLWEEVMYRDGIRVIPNTITVTSLFSKDELGWWMDILYKSKVDANAYTPEQYPQNWDIQVREETDAE